MTENEFNTTPRAASRRKKRKAKKNRVLTIVIVILLITISFSMYMNKDNPLLHGIFSGFGVSDNPTVIEFEKTENYAMSNFNGDAIIARNTSVFCVDDNMSVRWDVAQNNSDPVIKISGKYTLTYSFDVANAVVTKNGKASEIATDNVIIGGSINKNGYFALVTREKGYKALISVYSPEGDILYKWHSADNYVIDVDISYDNRTLAVATADFSTNTASGGIMLFNFSQEKPYAGQIIENNIIMEVQFVDKDSLLAVGDIGSLLINIKGDKETEYSYEGKKLTNYDIGTGYGLVLALNEGDSVKNDTEIKILNKKLKDKGTYTATGSISCIDYVNERILLASDRNVTLLNNRGKEIKKLNINKDIKNAVLYDEGFSALISSGSIVELVKFD